MNSQEKIEINFTWKRKLEWVSWYFFACSVVLLYNFTLCAVISFGFGSGMYFVRKTWLRKPRDILKMLFLLTVGLIAFMYIITKWPHEHKQTAILHDIFINAWETRSSDSANAMYVVNYIQKQFNCCGLNGPKDYQNDGSLPSSCCRSDDCTSKDNIFKMGCSVTQMLL